MVVSFYAQVKMDFILEVPTYLNLRLGTGSRVLYFLLAENCCSREPTEVSRSCAFCAWLLTVGRSSGSTKHSLQPPAVML